MWIFAQTNHVFFCLWYEDSGKRSFHLGLRAESTSLSVYHLHCYVITLQNIWRVLYVLTHPVFSRKKLLINEEDSCGMKARGMLW